MTDTLRDLLHESVMDAEMPDLADVAWRSRARARRRRGAAAVAGVAATALVTGVVVWAVDRGSGGHEVAPVHQPTDRPGSGRDDASYHGVPVWWSPRLAQEPELPAYTRGPLPATMDVTDVGREISPTVSAKGRGLAAFAVVGDAPDRVMSVGVLDPEGQVQLVDTTRVQPMLDPEGKPRVDVGASMLSPTGAYLMFPQQHSLLVLELATGQWQTIHTGDVPTWDATWSGDRFIALPDPNDPTAPAPTFSVSGVAGRTANDLGQGVPEVPVGSSQAYGPSRRAPTFSSYVAQAFGAGAPIRQPPSLHLDPGQSDWISATGGAPAILLIAMEPGRQKQCCQVATWLSDDTLVYESRSTGDIRLLSWQVGTGAFSQVSTIVGIRPRVSVVSSYADLAR